MANHCPNGAITLSRHANGLLEPMLEQLVDQLRTAPPGRIIETSVAIT